MFGAALFGGLTLVEHRVSPEPAAIADASDAPVMRGAMPPTWEAAQPAPTAPTTASTAAFTIDASLLATPVAAEITPAATAPTNNDVAGTLAAPADANPPPPDAAAQPEPAAPTQTVEVRPGDTPVRMLTRMGVAPEEAQAAIRTLSTVWNPRELKAGQKAAVFVQSDRLLSIRLALAPDRDVVVARDDTGNFVAEDQDRPVHQVAALGSGTIQTSLSAAASRAGVPIRVLDEMVRAFSYDVDFQREIHPGDTFTVLYQRVDDEFGHPTGNGQMAYAEMVLGGTRLQLFRFTPQDGETGYFNALGENIRKSLLRTPIDGAHITSGFGMRFHPILGYSRMHRGVDFGAPIGTAVYAAGDGTVTRAEQVSGYGNYIELQHNQEYATAYGHLSGFAPGLHEGEHVRQGDVIGYVGMTGLATGPHLHYEVHYDGNQIDPLSVKMTASTRLADSDLKAFENIRRAVERQLIELRQDLVARADCRGGAC